MQSFFDYSKEIKQAIQARKPLLALESTILTHGLPYPQNLETAFMLQQIVREHDVAPATIAIMDGKIKIGLSDAELEALVQDKKAVKVSRRDIPYALSQKINAGTTVAATLFCAHLAGIKVFATGGIGGVHRGDGHDVSADLIEIARTPLAIVCSGAKAILDLPRTLEFLETFSIPVIGYQTHYLPAFYTAKTTFPLPSYVSSVNELAALLTTHWELNMSTGVLVANPIPQQAEIASDVIEPAITLALTAAAQNNVTGKAITPFLLEEIKQVTQGKSVAANIELIKNNVKLASLLVKRLAME